MFKARQEHLFQGVPHHYIHLFSKTVGIVPPLSTPYWLSLFFFLKASTVSFSPLTPLQPHRQLLSGTVIERIQTKQHGRTRIALTKDMLDVKALLSSSCYQAGVSYYSCLEGGFRKADDSSP